MSSVARGRGHKKEKPLVRKVRDEHGQAVISIPQRVLRAVGIVLNTNVKLSVRYTDPNPFKREVTLTFIKPKLKGLPNQFVKRDRKGERKEDPANF